MTRIRNCSSRSFICFAALFVCSFGSEAAAQGLPGRGAGIGFRSSRQATSPARGAIRGAVQVGATGVGVPQGTQAGQAYTGGYNGALFSSPWLLPGWGWNIPQGYLAQSYPAYGGYRGMGFLPPVAIEPRLGLQHSYPFSWQMGIQMPVDASPLATPSLGPFEGVVRSQERAARLGSPAARNGVALLRKGKYRNAGLLLAGAYRDSDDPIHPLLLAEALFGLGKYQHAELVLRKALESEGAFAVLPEDVAGHFPSAKAFQDRLAELASSGKHKLLSAYMSLFAEDGSAGVAALLALAKADDLAAGLYRHYLDRVFGAEKPEAEAPAEGAEEK